MRKRKVISQREGRRLQKEVLKMRQERELMMRTWGSDYPGVHIDTITVSDVEAAIFKTAIALKHPVVLRYSGSNRDFYIYAVR